jgi:hypothetical protein
MKVIARRRIKYGAGQRICLIKPKGPCEWIALLKRGWGYHENIFGKRYVIKYYGKVR